MFSSSLVNKTVNVAKKEQWFLTVTPRGAFCPAKAHRATSYSSASEQICVYREDPRFSDEIAVALFRKFFAWRVVGYFLRFLPFSFFGSNCVVASLDHSA